MSFWTYLGGALVCVLGGAVIGFVAGRGKKPESSAEELQLLRDLRAKMEAAWNSHVQLDVERIKATHALTMPLVNGAVRVRDAQGRFVARVKL